MSYRILCVGKLKDEERGLFDRYAKRLGKQLTVTELSESQSDRLADKIDSKLPVVALDERGKNLSTIQLHDWLADRDYRAQFVIGAADGLPSDITNQSDLTIAFGAMTWPHQFVRAMLAEQLYRVETIRQGHPYHRR